RGSGDQWRLVADELTGTLIVTATPVEQERIAALMERLDSMPAEGRRPLRVFSIHNRDVRQIVEVLSKLVEAGVLDSWSVEDGSSINQINHTPHLAPHEQTTVNVQPPIVTVSPGATGPPTTSPSANEKT